MLHATKQETVADRFANLFERFEQSESYHLDAAKLEISEQIYLAMEQQGVSKAELARRLGKSRAYITKVLQGSTNFTLESLIRIARALECRFNFEFTPEHDTAKSIDELEELWQTSLRASVFTRTTMKHHYEYRRLVDPSTKATALEREDETFSVAA